MGVISIDYRDRRPIYEQLVVNIRELIIKGVFKPEEHLPSVRSLASELGINPNTIQKAYAELERQNIIYSVIGRGSIVCSDMAGLIETQKEELYENIGNIIDRAKFLGISREKFSEYIDDYWQKGEKDDKN